MPTPAVWRRVLPYYRPYRRQFLFGLVLVAASSALVSVVPWLAKRALDGIRDSVPTATIVWIAAEMIGISLVAGTMRYGMRELLNAVSRWMEYDLRNAL